MDFSLTDDQKMLREEIVRFARKELTPGAMERDEARCLCARAVAQMWRDGPAGVCRSLKPTAAPAWTRFHDRHRARGSSFGYGCEDGGLTFAICAHLPACVVPIWKHGSEEQKQRLLPELTSGRMIAVNAMTEPESGSDAFAIKTRAVRDGDHFVINGVKTFSSNGPVANIAVLYARTDPDKGYLGGVTAFLVEEGTPGFSKGQVFQKMSLRTCPIGELVFDNVRLPESAVLGTVGGGGPIFNQSMEWERTCLVAAHLGTMERLLDKSVEYAKSRKSFGQRIGSFRAVSHRIADMKVRLEAAAPADLPGRDAARDVEGCRLRCGDD